MWRSHALAAAALLLAASVGLACGPGGSPGGGGRSGGGGMTPSSFSGGGGSSGGRVLYGPGSELYDMAMQRQLQQAYLQMAMAKAAAQAQLKQQKLDSRIARRESEQARLAASRAKRQGTPAKAPPVGYTQDYVLASYAR